VARGYGVPWQYGAGPPPGPRLEGSGWHRPRWLAVLAVGFLLLLVAVLAAVLAWIALGRRRGRASRGGAQEILERRLAEGRLRWRSLKSVERRWGEAGQPIDRRLSKQGDGERDRIGTIFIFFVYTAALKTEAPWMIVGESGL